MSRAQTVVVDGEVVVVEVDDSGGPRLLDVTVTASGVRSHFTLAGWRGLSFGVGAGTTYAWTAREVLVLLRAPVRAGRGHHRAPRSAVDVLLLDDDLVVVFRRATHWIAVCETSVRVFEGDQVGSRIELGEAVEAASWGSGVLELTYVGGGRSRVRVAADGSVTVGGVGG